MPRLLFACVAAVLALASLPAVAQPSAVRLVSPVQDARLTTPGVNGSGFPAGLGFSVAFSGDRALVGAVGEDAGNTDAGAAYVFVRTASGWEQEARLVAPDGPGYYGFFGFAVALSGDRAFVTDQTSRDDFRRGAVHVFVRSGGTWTYEARLLDSDRFTIFGRSVSASGDRVLVGAIRENGGFGFSGAAHVFTRSGATWSREATLRASSFVAGDLFGTSVSLLGDRALVGASRDGASGTDSGAAYLFARADGSWVQEARLAPERLTAGDQFGASVSLGQGRVLIGAPARTSDPTPASRAGAAYTFVRSPDGAWTLESWLGSPDSPGYDAFGDSVSLLADQMLVGAPFEGDTGVAHLFSRAGGGWQQTDAIASADGAAGDEFGSAVALSDGRALIGASGADVADRPSAGAAYVFSGLSPTSADDEPAARPTLSPPFPNPATQHASMRLQLDRPQHIRAVVVDALGREVAMLLDAEVTGSVRLDVDTAALVSGVYVVRIVGEAFTETRRLTVVR